MDKVEITPGCKVSRITALVISLDPGYERLDNKPAMNDNLRNKVKTAISELGLEINIDDLLMAYTSEDIIKTAEGIKEIIHYNPNYKIEPSKFFDLLEEVSKFGLEPEEIPAYELGLGAISDGDYQTIDSMVKEIGFMEKPSRDPTNSQDSNRKYDRLPAKKLRNHKPPKKANFDSSPLIVYGPRQTSIEKEMSKSELPEVNRYQLRKARALLRGLNNGGNPCYLEEQLGDLKRFPKSLFPTSASLYENFLSDVEKAIDILAIIKANPDFAKKKNLEPVSIQLLYKVSTPVGYEVLPRNKG
jgi:hypothetical protein